MLFLCILNDSYWFALQTEPDAVDASALVETIRTPSASHNCIWKKQTFAVTGNTFESPQIKDTLIAEEMMSPPDAVFRNRKTPSGSSPPAPRL